MRTLCISSKFEIYIQLDKDEVVARLIPVYTHTVSLKALHVMMNKTESRDREKQWANAMLKSHSAYFLRDSGQIEHVGQIKLSLLKADKK